MRITEITTPVPVYYHGTARNNHAFRPDRVSYWTPSFDIARRHALMDAEHDGGLSVVIAAQIPFQKPVEMDSFQMQDLHLHPDQVQELRQAGHDVVFGIESPDELCVIDPRIVRVIEVKPIK